MPPQTRMTKQRRVILEELRRVTTHPTADEVYDMVRQRLPRISLGTIYRNLDVLAESGEILKLESAGNQKRFDGNIMPHAHIRCTRCGRLGDVMNVPARIPAGGAEAEGFFITGARVEFEGVCNACEVTN
ncbi:Fur family transcriptional regulator [Desulfovibrio psychrotolerans]|uniref:Transcriptional repressor n=1 Tax=Desulfovibrio psychrotolerans TaxID=415242 RepID=A0A7J0BY52_9BACT|nr:transcriptional repressor [Desulfovibrio psychrotolerans]GFM38101.1 transcriptional repressor [Desulfovibrio psychrotolerans]